MVMQPDLLILDDFSLGLDPGYRRLFIDYMREYAKAEKKTVFLTSHIIQDMERLIDDILIMDYNRVLVQSPVRDFTTRFKEFTFELDRDDIELKDHPLAVNVEHLRNHYEFYTYGNEKRSQTTTGKPRHCIPELQRTTDDP